MAVLIRREANFEPQKENLKKYPQGVLYKKGSQIKVNTAGNKARFLLLAGKKIEEPIAWSGPIVMNSREELAATSRELDNRTFIKNKAEQIPAEINKLYQED